MDFQNGEKYHISIDAIQYLNNFVSMLKTDIHPTLKYIADLRAIRQKGRSTRYLLSISFRVTERKLTAFLKSAFVTVQ